MPRKKKEEPEEQKEPAQPVMRPARPFISNGLQFDVDPDKLRVFKAFKELMDITAPDIDIIGPTEWRKQDRKYFFDHPMESVLFRETSEEEKLHIADSTMRYSGRDLMELEKSMGPYFKCTLVCNIAPGFRARVSVDRLDRDPMEIAVFSGWAPPGIPIYSPVYQAIDHMADHWTEALQEAETSNS